MKAMSSEPFVVTDATPVANPVAEGVPIRGQPYPARSNYGFWGDIHSYEAPIISELIPFSEPRWKFGLCDRCCTFTGDCFRNFACRNIYTSIDPLLGALWHSRRLFYGMVLHLLSSRPNWLPAQEDRGADGLRLQVRLVRVPGWTRGRVIFHISLFCFTSDLSYGASSPVYSSTFFSRSVT